MLTCLLRAVPVWAWALAALLTWGGFQRHQAKTQTAARARAEQSAALATASAQAQAVARDTERKITTQARKATDAAHTLQRRALADAADARAQLERLRSDLATATTARAASGSASAPSGTDGAASLRAVVTACAGQLVDVAADADTCTATLTGLQGWVRGVLPASQ